MNILLILLLQTQVCLNQFSKTAPVVVPFNELLYFNPEVGIESFGLNNSIYRIYPNRTGTILDHKQVRKYNKVNGIYFIWRPTGPPLQFQYSGIGTIEVRYYGTTPNFYFNDYLNIKIINDKSGGYAMTGCCITSAPPLFTIELK